MCLAIPYKIISKTGNKAKIYFEGKKINIRCDLIKANVGDFVLVQNGLIVKKIDKKNAQEILNILKINK